MITNIEPIADQGPLLSREEIDDKIDRYTMELDTTTDIDDRQQLVALINQYKILKTNS